MSIVNERCQCVEGFNVWRDILGDEVTVDSSEDESTLHVASLKSWRSAGPQEEAIPATPWQEKKKIWQKKPPKSRTNTMITLAETGDASKLESSDMTKRSRAPSPTLDNESILTPVTTEDRETKKPRGTTPEIDLGMKELPTISDVSDVSGSTISSFSMKPVHQNDDKMMTTTTKKSWLTLPWRQSRSTTKAPVIAQKDEDSMVPQEQFASGTGWWLASLSLAESVLSYGEPNKVENSRAHATKLPKKSSAKRQSKRATRPSRRSASPHQPKLASARTPRATGRPQSFSSNKRNRVKNDRHHSRRPSQPSSYMSDDDVLRSSSRRQHRSSSYSDGRARSSSYRSSSHKPRPAVRDRQSSRERGRASSRGRRSGSTLRARHHHAESSPREHYPSSDRSKYPNNRDRASSRGRYTYVSERRDPSNYSSRRRCSSDEYDRYQWTTVR